MTTIRLDFRAGRYHATPYGRHVNEGVAEWPPSPYRLLRALFDVWKRKRPDLCESEVEGILASLSESPPTYALPQATATHTRSYLSANSKDPTDKNLVFDAFLAFEPESSCFVVWPDLVLSDSQQATLNSLLNGLNYLGRSESWIDARLYRSNITGYGCAPVDDGDGSSGEVVPVACVVAKSSYKEKRPWLDALAASTNEVLKARASAPPLLRYVRYLRPDECIQTAPITAPRRVQPDADSVLLTLDSTVLPLATAAVEVAEQIRIRLMGAHKRLMGGDESQVSPLFSGKRIDGEKRRDHGHVYILPLPDASGWRINRVLLASRSGPWTRAELDAVSGVRRLWQRDDRPDVRCVVAWQGRRGDVRFRDIWQNGCTVESVTPFVPPRHWRKGRDFRVWLDTEVRRECSNHGMPEPVTVEIEERIKGSQFECVEYRRNRKDDPVRAGYALRLQFREPVVSPCAIGYGAHFGLGLLRAF